MICTNTQHHVGQDQILSGLYKPQQKVKTAMYRERHKACLTKGKALAATRHQRTGGRECELVVKEKTESGKKLCVIL